MASAKYHDFIQRMASFGFPVKFLREVESGYRILPGISSQVLPWFNIMLLEPDEFNSLELMSTPQLGASTGIENIYHEATHAWVDIHSDRADVAKLVSNGVAHYKEAPVEGGQTANAPRLFQEAVASYVGHRAASYWRAIEATKNMAFMLNIHKGHPEAVRADHALLNRVPKNYDNAMNQRVFGYQTRCNWCAQKQTSKLISGEIKRFADTVLLESKIPDQFARAGSVFDTWRKASRQQ